MLHTDIGTDYLRCGDNCFMKCNGGLVGQSLDTETFREVYSAQDCKKLCNLANGCISYKHSRKQCKLKYNKQKATGTDTCKGDTFNLDNFTVCLICREL